MAAATDPLLDAHIRIPDHVVHRTFVAETVVLNLQTGRYHGLNTMAGRMLEALGEGTTVRQAAERIAGEFDVTVDVVEADLVAFCRDLLDRRLIELVAQDG